MSEVLTCAEPNVWQKRNFASGLMGLVASQSYLRKVIKSLFFRSLICTGVCLNRRLAVQIKAVEPDDLLLSLRAGGVMHRA